jgi:hypothetical protein
MARVRAARKPNEVPYVIVEHLVPHFDDERAARRRSRLSRSCSTMERPKEWPPSTETRRHPTGGPS